MKINTSILIATTNPHKVKRLTEIVRPFFSQIMLLTSLSIPLSFEENGSSFEENAVIKATNANKLCKGYVVATDAGMVIPSLGKLWNPLQTKRFAGDNTSDVERINKLLLLMKDKKTDKQREMHWEEAVAFSYCGKKLFSYTAKGPSGILQKEFNPRFYQEGIWLCSLWYLPEFKRNYFELTEKEKHIMESNWADIKKELRSYLTFYSRELPFLAGKR